MFHVSITPTTATIDKLENEELFRLNKKLKFVEEAAQRLAANMLKGTLKYDTDTHSVDEWLEHGLDESVDMTNYWMMLREEIRRERNERTT